MRKLFNKFLNLIGVRRAVSLVTGCTDYARTDPDLVVNAIVAFIQCDGCMATDHTVKFIGEVIRFERCENRYIAILKILKQGSRDHRDHDLGECRVDTSELQKLSTNFYAKFH
jgi:hypothetical protein